jgi:hypothetical protein
VPVVATGKKLSNALNSSEIIERLQEECAGLPPAQLIERVLGALATLPT